MRSAEDARKLTNRCGGETPAVHQAITDLVQERIGRAAKSGLSQVTIELPYRLYKAVDLDALKAELSTAGYKYMNSGINKGLLGQSLFTEAKYCITIMW